MIISVLGLEALSAYFIALLHMIYQKAEGRHTHRLYVLFMLMMSRGEDTGSGAHYKGCQAHRAE